MQENYERRFVNGIASKFFEHCRGALEYSYTLRSVDKVSPSDKEFEWNSVHTFLILNNEASQ